MYGCLGVVEDRYTSPASTTRPAYITTTRSASSATRPRSWVMRMIAAWSRAGPPEHLQDLRLDRHVERGGRLVGDQTYGSLAIAMAIIDALPHAAGQLVRILA